MKNFIKYKVGDVNNLEEFCQKYYKRERYEGRGKDYANACLESHKKKHN